MSSLDALKTHLDAASVPTPDDATLETILAVEGGDALRAAQLVIDDYRASHPGAAAAAAAASSSSALTQDDDRGLRRRAGGRTQMEEMGFANDEDEYEAMAVRGRGASTRPPPPGSGGAGGGIGGGGGLASLLYHALTLPFSALQGLLFALLRILRLPGIIAGLFSSASGGTNEGGITAAEEFLEMVRSRAGPAGEIGATATATATDGGIDATSTTTPTPPPMPPLLTCSYNDALRKAKSELKMLVVLLTRGAENVDSDSSRLVSTLTAPEVVAALSQSDYLVWGASTHRREGSLVARQLAVYRYPFMGCVAMTVPRGALAGLSDTPGELSVVSRTFGSALLSPHSLTEKLSAAYARCVPSLESLRAEAVAREAERRLMEEQDRAYAEASARDAQRVAARRAEEARLRAEEEARREAERQRGEELRRKVLWRRWAVRYLLSGTEPPRGSEGTTEVSAVLPHGRRIRRVFSVGEPLEHVFAWIDTSAVAPQDETDEDDGGGGGGGKVAAGSGAGGRTSDPPSDYTHTYTFSLFYGYPRTRLGPEALAPGRTIADVQGLSPRANVIVEGRVDADEGSSSDEEEEDEDEGEESSSSSGRGSGRGSGSGSGRGGQR